MRQQFIELSVILLVYLLLANSALAGVISIILIKQDAQKSSHRLYLMLYSDSLLALLAANCLFQRPLARRTVLQLHLLP